MLHITVTMTILLTFYISTKYWLNIWLYTTNNAKKMYKELN